METVDADFVIRVVIGLVVITAPIDPVKLLFFNTIVDQSGEDRTRAGFRLSVYVTIILAVSALVGKELLEAIGVNLDVFGAVGGIVIAGMGFEMLYGGAPSRAQGEDEREAGPAEGDGLLIPLAIPLIAGPGATTTTTITFSSQNTNADDHRHPRPTRWAGARHTRGPDAPLWAQELLRLTSPPRGGPEVPCPVSRADVRCDADVGVATLPPRRPTVAPFLGEERAR